MMTRVASGSVKPIYGERKWQKGERLCQDIQARLYHQKTVLAGKVVYLQ